MTNPAVVAPDLVAGAEIVARWIEAGCPNANLASNLSLMASHVRALAAPRPESAVPMQPSAVTDALAFELTGFRPEQMNERESAIIRERAQKRWGNLCALAAPASTQAGGGAKLLLEKIDTLIACINEAHTAKSSGWKQGCFDAADNVLEEIRSLVAAAPAAASTLPERIAELIEQHGSLRAAARVLGCDAGYLSRLQSGEKADPGALLLRRMGVREITTYERTKP